MPPQLTVEDLKKPHTSFPANPFIANVFYLADYAQRAGSGTPEMIERCKNQNAPEPEFMLIRNVEFRTILPRDVFTEKFLSRLGLNGRQIKAIKYIKENGKITNKEYTNLTKVNSRTSLRDLNNLCDRNILEKVGFTGRNIQYILTRHEPDINLTNDISNGENVKN